VALADPRRGVHPPAPGRRRRTGYRSPQPPAMPPGAGRRRPAPCGTSKGLSINGAGSCAKCDLRGRGRPRLGTDSRPRPHRSQARVDRAGTRIPRLMSYHDDDPPPRGSATCCCSTGRRPSGRIRLGCTSARHSGVEPVDRKTVRWLQEARADLRRPRSTL